LPSTQLRLAAIDDVRFPARKLNRHRYTFYSFEY
jgi:hypothetical protein